MMKPVNRLTTATHFIAVKVGLFPFFFREVYSDSTIRTMAGQNGCLVRLINLGPIA